MDFKKMLGFFDKSAQIERSNSAQIAKERLEFSMRVSRQAEKAQAEQDEYAKSLNYIREEIVMLLRNFFPIEPGDLETNLSSSKFEMNMPLPEPQVLRQNIEAYEQHKKSIQIH